MYDLHCRSPDRAVKSLQSLPGVGSSIAADLARLGYREPEDLAGENPEAMFAQLQRLTGSVQDPLVLDHFRCAVHSASSLEHDAELIKPWVWGRLRHSATPDSRPSAPLLPAIIGRVV
ncbi:MAG: pathogenicity locus [Myxococcales bacterium]|nr:pathogenicity locus [Myxococcales bacterium]